jgi:mRNA-degrading endonuclease RelE of RelBE toxin-antitoxin system
MDRISKALAKLSNKERQWVRDILVKLQAGGTKNLQIQKLRGRHDVYRVRKGQIRIIYRDGDDGQIYLLAIDRRNEQTYKLL